MTIEGVAKPARRRITLAVLAVATIGIGLVVHRGVGGAIGDVLGDALYAALIYQLVALIGPRRHRAVVALVAFAVCAGIELLQLTGLPRDLASTFPPIELVLGSGFDPRDIAVYAGAVVVTALVDGAVTRILAGVGPGNATGRAPEGERPV